MKLPFTTLDVFTKSRYAGNPLAIVRVPAGFREQLTEEQKQKIATEFNLSETVFLHDATQATEPVLYDIFTPRSRIPFAGHPTIGAAVYVSRIAPDEFPGTTTTTLHTPLVGDVPLSYDPDSETASVVVPHDLRVHQKRLPHPVADPKANPSGLPDCPIVSIVKGMSFIMVPVSDLNALEVVPGSIVPAADTYKGLHLDPGSGWDKGIVNTMYYVDLTGPPEERMHGAPAEWVLRTRVIGRIEDPGTGSASCALCSFLALGLPKGLGAGPFRFQLVQGVEMGRRNDIYATVTRTQDGEAVRTVELSGSAVRVMEGVIEV